MSGPYGLRSGAGLTAQQAIAGGSSLSTSHAGGPQPSSKSKVNKSKLNRIKQPMNAYILWSCDQRCKLAKKHPRMKPSEITQRMGAEWKLLTKTEKAPFFEEAQRLKAVHMEEHPEYKYPSRRSTKVKKPAGKGPTACQENGRQQKVNNGERRQLYDEQEQVPNISGILSTTSDSSSSAAADTEQQVPNDEEEEQQQAPDAMMPYDWEQELQQPVLISEKDQQQQITDVEQVKMSIISGMPSSASNSSSTAAAHLEKEELTLVDGEKERHLLVDGEEEHHLLVDGEEEEQQLVVNGLDDLQQQVPVVEQVLLPNNLDDSWMSSATSTSLSTASGDPQQQLTENGAQHEVDAIASSQPVTQLSHLTGMVPHRTSAFTALTPRYGSVSAQYGLVPSQLQLGYPGWDYPVSHLPQNSYAEPTNAVYHQRNYPPAQCPAPPRVDSPDLGLRSNGEGKKIRKPRTTFSSLQLQQLNRQFQRNQNPTVHEETELAAYLGLTHIQVKTWFLNRRAKFKNMLKTAQQFGFGVSAGPGGYPYLQQHQGMSYHGQMDHDQASHHLAGGGGRPFVQQPMGEAASGYWNPNSAPTVPNRNLLEGSGFYGPRQFNPTVVSNTSPQ